MAHRRIIANRKVGTVCSVIPIIDIEYFE